MWEFLQKYKAKELSSKQRQWVEKVYLKLDLDKDEPARNLASSGKVKVTEAERKSLQDWTNQLGPKVLKPPSRKTP